MPGAARLPPLMPPSRCTGYPPNAARSTPVVAVSRLVRSGRTRRQQPRFPRAACLGASSPVPRGLRATMSWLLSSIVGSGKPTLAFNVGEAYSDAWGAWVHCRGTSKVPRFCARRCVCAPRLTLLAVSRRTPRPWTCPCSRSLAQAQATLSLSQRATASSACARCVRATPHTAVSGSVRRACAARRECPH